MVGLIIYLLVCRDMGEVLIFFVVWYFVFSVVCFDGDYMWVVYSGEWKFW